MALSKFGPLRVVNTFTTGSQYQATAAGLVTGEIFVTWYDANLHTIRAQKYDALGNPIDFEFTPGLYDPGSVRSGLPRIAARPDGGYLLAWVSEDPGPVQDANLHTERGAGYSSDENTGAMTGVRNFPVAKFFRDNLQIFAFEDDTINSGDIIFGVNSTPNTPVNTATAGLQTWPDLAVLAGHQRYVFSWWDDLQKVVKFRLFGDVVTPITPEIVAGSVGTAPGTQSFGYRGQAVAALAGGNFVVVWHSLDASAVDGDNYGVQASVFDFNGAPVKTGFQVNTTTAGVQNIPSVVGLLDGGFAVAWKDVSTGSSRAVLRTFDASGNPTSAEFLVGAGHDEWAPQLALLADGRIVVTWEADMAVPEDGSGWHTEMQIVDPRGAAVILSANDLGVDLVGTPFNDTFIDGHGNDRFTGNGGVDTVSFARATAGVTVDLSLAAAQTVGGGLGSDTLDGVHRLIGSSFNDVLTGSVGADTLDGGPGIDIMRGGAGGDTYFVGSAGEVVSEAGGAGIDTVVSSVSFSLPAGVDKLTLTGSAALTGIGNTLANTIVGNAGANLLRGTGGNDTVTGGQGSDRIYGETGNDTLAGGPGNDTLAGGSGIDRLTGGPGNDIFRFDTAPGATNRDVITDFANAAGNNDTVQLNDAVFTKLGAGGTRALNPAFFHAGAAAADANDHIIYNKATGALFYDTNGNAAGGVIQIATLTNHATLTAADFVVL
jgi:Ca2+-binding RTX toxin-like protein